MLRLLKSRVFCAVRLINSLFLVQLSWAFEFQYIANLVTVSRANDPFFLNFVIDVDKSSLESIVCHAVDDRLGHKTKVEGLVTAAHVGILKPDVNICELDAQIFPNELHIAVKVAFRLLGSGFLCTFLHIFYQLINDGVFLAEEHSLTKDRSYLSLDLRMMCMSSMVIITGSYNILVMGTSIRSFLM